MFKIILITLICLQFLNLVSCNQIALKNLFIIHRHGDRATEYSSNLCPTDSNLYDVDKKWPLGIGHLTKDGKNRMFNIGKFLRKKYNEFLGDNIREFEIRSSNYDRCIESTQLLMNGIFKNNTKLIPLNCNYFPVHTIPISLDSMLYPFSNCPNSNRMLINLFNSDYGQNLNTTFKPFYEYLSKKCDVKISHIRDLYHLYDVLSNELATDLQSPKWSTNSTIQKLYNATLIYFHLMSSTKEIQKLRTGIFLNDLYQKIEKSIKSTNESIILNDDQLNEKIKKVYVYSTHDIFLIYLMVSLGIDNELLPPYGSTLLLELYKDNNDKLDWQEISSFKIKFYNETNTDKLYELTIPNCKDKERCTIKELRNLIDDLLIDQSNWEIECGLKMNLNNLNIINYINKDKIILIISFTLIIIHLILSILIFVCKKRCL